MLSVIVGCALGLWVSRGKVGLVVVLLYGVIVGVISANVSYHDGAGLLPAVLALVGFGLARLVVGVRHARKVKSRHGQAELLKNVARPSSVSEHRSAVPTGAGGDREDVYVAAGLSHATFLNVLGRELDDLEFVAAALGAFDGTVQALDREFCHVDMLAMGSVFALRQIGALQRMPNASPRAMGDAIGLAMVSPEHEELRAKSGQVAFTVTKKLYRMQSI